MAFLETPPQFIVQQRVGWLPAPAGPESTEGGAAPSGEVTEYLSYPFKTIEYASIQSVQLAGDRNSARFHLTMNLERSPGKYVTRSFWLDATRETVIVSAAAPDQATSKVTDRNCALPSRYSLESPIVRDNLDFEVRAVQTEVIVVHDAQGYAVPRVKLTFCDAFTSPSKSSSAFLDLPATGTYRTYMAAVYGFPNVKGNELLVIAYSKLGKVVKPSCAWLITPDGKQTAVPVPSRLKTSPVSKGRSLLSRRTMSTSESTSERRCDSCRVWIEYGPGDPYFEEHILCDDDETVNNVETNGHELIEITHHEVDEENCTSLYVEYRAYPPTNESEVDCRQDKVEDHWEEPDCAPPAYSAGYLVSSSKFTWESPEGPLKVELAAVLSPKGELFQYERYWDGKVPEGGPESARYGCPGAKAVTLRTHPIQLSEGEFVQNEDSRSTYHLKLHHAAAYADDRTCYARTYVEEVAGIKRLHVTITKK